MKHILTKDLGVAIYSILKDTHVAYKAKKTKKL